ncbi:MAG: hypothetical protein ABEL76_17715 [Bradymonadaceae bacterium]
MFDMGGRAFPHLEDAPIERDAAKQEGRRIRWVGWRVLSLAVLTVASFALPSRARADGASEAIVVRNKEPRCSDAIVRAVAEELKLRSSRPVRVVDTPPPNDSSTEAPRVRLTNRGTSGCRVVVSPVGVEEADVGEVSEPDSVAIAPIATRTAWMVDPSPSRLSSGADDRSASSSSGGESDGPGDTASRDGNLGVVAEPAAGATIAPGGRLQGLARLRLGMTFGDRFALAGVARVPMAARRFEVPAIDRLDTVRLRSWSVGLEGAYGWWWPKGWGGEVGLGARRRIVGLATDVDEPEEANGDAAEEENAAEGTGPPPEVVVPGELPHWSLSGRVSLRKRVGSGVSLQLDTSVGVALADGRIAAGPETVGALGRWNVDVTLGLVWRFDPR